ncbi:MAG: 5-formyltetrahydrofolate cyclo-ligase [Wujia sp.]
MDTSIQEQKKQLRKEILTIRRELTADEVQASSEKIGQKLLRHPMYQQAQDVCLYVPIQNEVDVFCLADKIRTDGKRVWLPRVKESTMDFYAWERDTEFIAGAYGILEPDTKIILQPQQSDAVLIVMPGAVFSKQKDRIGYGGGYYDRYLMQHPQCATIAVAYHFQQVEAFACEDTDIRPMDIIYDAEK